MCVLVTACMPRGLLQLSPLQLQKELAVDEGCCHCNIGPMLWAPSLSVLQLKSSTADASVIACTTRGSSACHLCNSKEYLQCKQVIVTACTNRSLCFSVLQLKANFNSESKRQSCSECYCLCSWHKHGHTRRRKWGVHLQLQDEREGEKKGKRQEYGREHVLRMRAHKPNKSGHEYECNHTIEYTTFLPSNL